MPMPRVRTATAVNVGFLKRSRRPKRTSRRIPVMPGCVAGAPAVTGLGPRPSPATGDHLVEREQAGAGDDEPDEEEEEQELHLLGEVAEAGDLVLERGQHRDDHRAAEEPGED